MNKILFQANQFKTEFRLEETKEKIDNTVSIFLPPRESEFLNSLLSNGWKMKHFLKHALKKYQKILVRHTDQNRKIHKRIQSRSEKKERFSFRPNSSDWVEVQLLSLGLGVSCCIVVLELIRFEMNELLKKFVETLENVAMTTETLKQVKSFYFKYIPKTNTIKKNFIYCRKKVIIKI